MRPTLFRPEAVEFSRERSFGEVVLLRPPSSSWLTAGAIVLALAVVGFAFWGEYTRKAHVSGYLVPSKGVLKVYAPGPGTIVTKHVYEGQRVRRGEPLFVLSTERGSAETPQAQAAAIAQLHQRRDSLTQELTRQQDLVQIERRALEQRISSMEQQAVELNAQIDTQRQRIASAQKTVDRYRSLLAQRFVSEAVVQEKQEAVLDQKERSQSLQQNRVSLQRDLASAKLELDSNAVKANTQREATERDISVLDQQLTEYEARRTAVIPAPADGVITAILAQEGQNATTSTPLLSILPLGAELQAELLVPSRSIGFIATAQTVALRYQAFPYQRFGIYHGHVSQISKTIINPGDATLPVQIQEPTYRVTVSLDSQSVQAYRKEVKLQAGMALEADVLLDRRRLIEWVFDPLFSLTRRV